MPRMRGQVVGAAKLNIETWSYGYVLGRLTDVASTWAILRQGGTELNDLWAGLYADGGAMAAAGWQLILAAPIAWIVKAAPGRWRFSLGLGLLAASWFPVAWNAWQLA